MKKYKAKSLEKFFPGASCKNYIIFSFIKYIEYINTVSKEFIIDLADIFEITKSCSSSNINDDVKVFLWNVLRKSGVSSDVEMFIKLSM